MSTESSTSSTTAFLRPVSSVEAPARKEIIAAPAMVSLKHFFESTAPGTDVEVTEVGPPKRTTGPTDVNALRLPEISLYCADSKCEGVRIFTCDTLAETTVSRNLFLGYTCQNCKHSTKWYALLWKISGKRHFLQKYGEIWPFGPITPARLATLLGRERDLYFKGRRCESQSLGIAAFAYYRRVVESRKDTILDEIARIARGLGGNDELLLDLERARKESQFTKAVDAIKHPVPQALFVNGHDPLTLLHAALSDGPHLGSDEECLQLAASVRLVLTEFVERAAFAMKDEAELKAAVSKLLAINHQSISDQTAATQESTAPATVSGSDTL